MISKRILGFLVPVFIASLIYGYLQMPQQKRISAQEERKVPSQTIKKGLTDKSGGTAGNYEGYPRLRNDLLERKSEPYPGVRRDLFFAAFAAERHSSEEEAIVPPEKLPEVIIPPPVVEVVEVQPPPPPPPSPQELARKELSLYKFIGFFKKGIKQTIFLSSGDEIFLLRKGDYLGRDRKYYVLDISDTTLELRKEGTGDFFIKLTDQESFSTAALHEPKKPDRNPVSSPRAVQETSNLPDQPELLLPFSDEEPQPKDQLQLEEDNK